MADHEPPVSPWIDSARIRAATARDVLERGSDDRSSWERSAQAARSWAIILAAQPVRRRFIFGAKAKVKVERTIEERARHREYMREYMRESRARQKAATAPG